MSSFSITIDQEPVQQSQPNNHAAISFASPSPKEPKPLNEKALTRSPTLKSSDTVETKSVRSVLMRKMNLIKRRDIQRTEGPPYHTMDLNTVARLLKTDLENGVSHDQVEKRRAECGFNELQGGGGVNPVKLFLKQFLNLMVMILLIATVKCFSARKTRMKKNTNFYPIDCFVCLPRLGGR